jgi:dUTP pyrophosphatase
MSQPKLTVPISRLPGNDDLPIPDYHSDHAAAMDIHAAVDRPITLDPGEIRMIPTGFALAVPIGYEAQIRPRSGLAAKHGVSLVNSPGTIDADYRGEVKLIVINLGKGPFIIERGMRIAQMLIAPVPRVEWQEVEELPETARGQGGFGYTGS